MEDHLREVLTRSAQRHTRGGEAPRDALAALDDAGGEFKEQTWGACPQFECRRHCLHGLAKSFLCAHVLCLKSSRQTNARVHRSPVSRPASGRALPDPVVRRVPSGVHPSPAFRRSWNDRPSGRRWAHKFDDVHSCFVSPPHSNHLLCWLTWDSAQQCSHLCHSSRRLQSRVAFRSPARSFIVDASGHAGRRLPR